MAFSYGMTILDCAGVFEQGGQVTLLSLEVRIATNVLLGNEDVRDRSLVCNFLERVLNSTTVVYT